MSARKTLGAASGLLLIMLRAKVAAGAPDQMAMPNQTVAPGCPYRATHSMPLAMSWQDYPLLSVALGEQGAVVLDFLIKPDGSIADVQVAKSSGFARLDGAAVDVAGARWRFDPVMLEGKPIACRAKVAVAWKLAPRPEDLVNAGFALVHLDAADFPTGSPALKEKGAAAIMLMLTPEGKVADARVNQSSGFRDLDSIAVETARKGKWPYVAARIDGKPVKSIVGLLVEWSP